MKQCNHCLEWKDEKEFNWRNRLLGIRADTCKVCKREQDMASYDRHHAEKRKKVNEYLAKRRQIARDFVFDYLSYKVCEVCGEYRPEMLQFDHVSGTKKRNISDMCQRGESIEAIKEEILKCRVICANCHQMAERRKRGR